MSSKIVEYDLRQPGRDYDALYNAIKGFGELSGTAAWHNTIYEGQFLKDNL